jgi:hypothetical protein
VNGRVSVTPPADDPVIETGLTDLVREYDKRWSNLDFVGVSDLWEHTSPQPIYLGDEYPAPLIGADELDRHWARVSSRLKGAQVSSRLHSFDVVNDTIVRAVLFSRWRLTGRESDLERSGESWVTWLLARRDGQYRIFHHMEAQVYLTEDEG